MEGKLLVTLIKVNWSCSLYTEFIDLAPHPVFATSLAVNVYRRKAFLNTDLDLLFKKGQPLLIFSRIRKRSEASPEDVGTFFCPEKSSV